MSRQCYGFRQRHGQIQRTGDKVDIGRATPAPVARRRKLCLYFRFILLPGALLALAVGCSTPTGSYQAADFGAVPQFGEIARKSMDYEGVMRNPIIIIHGFLGAKLEDKSTGEQVWGSFYGMSSRNLAPHRLRGLSCPMVYGKPLQQIDSNATPVEMLSRVEVSVAGVPFHLQAYDVLVEQLAACGYNPDSRPLPPGKNFHSLFKFCYDWRYDLSWNAARLDEFILEKKAYLQKQYAKLYGLEDFDVQFDLVAHSMGGLLSRYYLRYGKQKLPSDGTLPVFDWRGSRHIDKVLLIGTPSAGYLDTWHEMLHGLQLQAGAPLYPPGIVGTFHTYYQMLPPLSTKPVVYADAPDEVVDIFDPRIWIRYGWGIVDPSQDKYLRIMLPDIADEAERRKVAIDHLSKCLARARQFIQAMRVGDSPPRDVALALFAGDAFPTRRRAYIDRDTGRIVRIDMEPGDGKVLASSARFDEREGQNWEPFLVSPVHWSQVMYLPAAHMGLMACPTFLSNATFFLWMRPTSHQRAKLGLYRQ